jgi:hypothetical protein
LAVPAQPGAQEARVKSKIHQDSLALARRIRAAGCPIYIEEDDGETRCIPSDGLIVYQVGGLVDSSAVDWSRGTGFKICLAITINLPMFAISDFALELPWKNDSFYWLQDPSEIDGISRCYRFGIRDFIEFERSEVINHYADVRRTFSSGQSLKGFLLGFGFDPIPDEFPHGMMIPAFLVICDQHWRKYRSPIKLWTDRSEKYVSRPRSGVPRRGLFDHPDRKVEHVPLMKKDETKK